MAAYHWLKAAAALGCIYPTVGCSQNPPPFEAVYTSRDTVAITYQGRRYLISRYGSSTSTPFKYRFEADGDLDIFINGIEYDIESPYDVDAKNKKMSVKKKADLSSGFKTKKQ